MAITNFGELKTAIETWLEYDTITANIPEFVSLAEDRIAQDIRLRIRPMETATDLTMSSQTTALPTGFIAARRLYLDGSPKKRLEFLTPENFWIRNLANQAGLPKFFTIEGEDVVLGPAPDTSQTGKLLYFKRFDALSGDTDTNWLLTNARGIYLYASLLEAAPFLGNDPRIMTWGTLYDDLVENVQKANKRDRYTGAPLMQVSDVQVDPGVSRSG